MRVLSRIRLSLLQEVSKLHAIPDAGPHVADGLEPADPLLIIDVGQSRAFSMLEGVCYSSVQVDANVKDVTEGNRAARRAIEPNWQCLCKSP